jgi:hypothetical protein
MTNQLEYHKNDWGTLVPRINVENLNVCLWIRLIVAFVVHPCKYVLLWIKLVEWLEGETEVLVENLPQCRFVHHKPHILLFMYLLKPRKT